MKTSIDEEKERKMNDNKERKYNEILDKLIKLQKGDQSPSFLKKIVYITTGICIVLIVILICSSIYKNNFTTESILATLLAFFSIFISIFFYFKADETSTKFYDSSYKFMKDISVTLGKIEERFGEKLNSLNDKLSQFDKESKETSKEIVDKQEDKDSIIDDLIEKTNLNEEEKAKYKKEIEKKDLEIEQLWRYQYQIEREAERLRQRINETNREKINISKRSYRNLLLNLLMEGKVPDDLPERTHNLLIKQGYIDSDGNVNKNLLLNDLNIRNNN